MDCRRSVPGVRPNHCRKDEVNHALECPHAHRVETIEEKNVGMLERRRNAQTKFEAETETLVSGRICSSMYMFDAPSCSTSRRSSLETVDTVALYQKRKRARVRGICHTGTLFLTARGDDTRRVPLSAGLCKKIPRTL